MDIKYTHYQAELEKIVEEDQNEIRSRYQKLKGISSESEKITLERAIKTVLPRESRTEDVDTRGN
jgi:hypothetical protein